MSLLRDRTIVALALTLVVLVAAGIVMPGWLRFVLELALAKGLVVLGLVVLMRAGLVSFGQGLYYCLGGYTAGMGGIFLGLTDALGLLLGGVAVSVAVASLLGLLLARYREIFFAMLSLALSMILYGLLVRARALGSTDGFNVHSATFLGFAPEGDTLRLATFLLTCGTAFVAAIVLHRYLRSTIGRLGDAIRTNELRVEYLGTSVRGVVHVKYVIAAGVAGAGGVLTALAVGHVDPELAYWTTSGEFVFVALLSGTGNVMAPFLGAILLELVRTYAFEYSPYTWQLILGATMLAIILFLPGGLWSLARIRQRAD
jgi:ABC-type branched-subunit amino acid transport system permease subunit